jgi:2-amino-4-hydroxy-6-hydroxymethyldihydropteridine diphosphokinase
MSVSYIALGSSMGGQAGAPSETLHAALEWLAQEGQVIEAASSFWCSAAWPDPADPPFVNAVAKISTDLSPRELLDLLRRLERRAGRTRDRSHAPRTLDLDLIAFDELVQDDPELIIPHPRALDRGFVMRPLAEIAPDWRCPRTGTTIGEALESLKVGLDAHICIQAGKSV